MPHTHFKFIHPSFRGRGEVSVTLRQNNLNFIECDKRDKYEIEVSIALSIGAI